jgi:hypothetical protein
MKNFNEWILEIGNGELGEGDGESSITIPADLIIKRLYYKLFLFNL